MDQQDLQGQQGQPAQLEQKAKQDLKGNKVYLDQSDPLD
jgi:hypothetical protein